MEQIKKAIPAEEKEKLEKFFNLLMKTLVPRVADYEDILLKAIEDIRDRLNVREEFEAIINDKPDKLIALEEEIAKKDTVDDFEVNVAEPNVTELNSFQEEDGDDKENEKKEVEERNEVPEITKTCSVEEGIASPIVELKINDNNSVQEDFDEGGSKQIEKETEELIDGEDTTAGANGQPKLIDVNETLLEGPPIASEINKKKKILEGMEKMAKLFLEVLSDCKTISSQENAINNENDVESVVEKVKSRPDNGHLPQVEDERKVEELKENGNSKSVTEISGIFSQVCKLISTVANAFYGRSDKNKHAKNTINDEESEIIKSPQPKVPGTEESTKQEEPEELDGKHSERNNDTSENAVAHIFVVVPSDAELEDGISPVTVNEELVQEISNTNPENETLSKEQILLNEELIVPVNKKMEAGEKLRITKNISSPEELDPLKITEIDDMGIMISEDVGNINKEINQERQISTFLSNSDT
ncbi:unnamed protein product [Hymenolepis diminuta]|uniref:Uncharacterized protein n=1 Tax=Hymenolepis diminuta TaxID=6216 RepID=A0A564YSK8_HYMDI|nr:unnamed protein product [Hymenolepis diminuta]